ncbi:amidohydrolase family protein [Nocardia sp. NPDC059764]|uniref:amidohydrolase family protein n=1 Tax=Nocardia sp. NPDC059764 TaxID=3346939 RepID=UPI003664A2CC
MGIRSRKGPQRALAVRAGRISAVSTDPNGLDHLVSAETLVHDLPDATVLPAFGDTHTHLIFAALGAQDVPVHRARNIPEFLDLIRQRASVTPEGEWIRTTTNWQELNLAERRMPTAAELDQATDRHPVLVKRGGHNDVVNTYALRLAGITENTPVPPRLLDVDTALIGALAEDGRATWTDLARRAGTTALTARRRVEALVAGQVLRLATEIDLALLGAHTEALLWIAVRPGALQQTAQTLTAHPHVRFCAATTGPANLVVAVAAADLDALYAFLTDTVGPLEAVTAIDVTPLLATVKRTGLIRH